METNPTHIASGHTSSASFYTIEVYYFHQLEDGSSYQHLVRVETQYADLEDAINRMIEMADNWRVRNEDDETPLHGIIMDTSQAAEDWLRDVLHNIRPDAPLPVHEFLDL